MGAKDPRVDAYIAKAEPFAKPILNRFRKAVHAGCPDVTETLKWSVPHFDYKGVLGGMAAFKAHCRVGFWKQSLLTSRAERQAVRSDGAASPTLADMPDERTLAKMAKEAAALNEAGVKVKRAVKPPKPRAEGSCLYAGRDEEEPEGARRLAGVQPVGAARIRRVGDRGEVGRDARSPPRDRGRLDRGRQEAQLEVRTIASLNP